MERQIVRSRLALRVPSVPATEADAQVARDLADTLLAHRHECVGLAANMVGARARVITVLDGAGEPLAMLNPEIVARSGPYEAEEGCLSLDGTRTARRWRRVTVRWQDEAMAWHEGRFSGTLAQAIQHEVDHCDGIVI